MGNERQRTRITSKIDQLPPSVKEDFDTMLNDTSITYNELSQWLLKEHKIKISKSAIGRYALRTNAAKQRFREAQEQTNQLVKMIKDNPDVDYTDINIRMVMAGLTERLAHAQEEWDDIELDKIGRLVNSLARTDMYKRKTFHDMKKSQEHAFNEMEERLMNLVKSHKDLSNKMSAVLKEARDQVLIDE
jgi:hypothetical protein